MKIWKKKNYQKEKNGIEMNVFNVKKQRNQNQYETINVLIDQKI